VVNLLSEFCLCGCGKLVNFPYKYCKGHNLIDYMKNLMPEKKKERYLRMVKTLKKTISKKTKEQWAEEGKKRTATRKKRYGNNWCRNPEERNKKIGIANKGRNHTLETKEKIRKIIKDVWIEKHCKYFREHPDELLKELFKNDEGRGKKKRVCSEERKKHLSKILKKKFGTPKMRKYFSDLEKEYWKEHPQEKIKRHEKQKKQFVSGPEYKVRKELLKNSIFFVAQQYISFINHSYFCDILIPSDKIIIEVDGTYWHNYPHGNELDHIRTKELEDAGYKVFRIWDDKNLEKNTVKVVKYIESLPRYIPEWFDENTMDARDFIRVNI